jgi:iron complex transport system substrate-binding protein
MISMLAIASGYTLGIFGNANMDDTIDEDDIAYVEGIIRGENEITELADANYDGRVDEKDVAQIQQMINGEDVEVNFLDSDNKVVTVKRPVERVLALGTTHVEVLRSLKAEDRIVGVSTYVTDKPDFFPEMTDVPTVGSGWTPDYEAIISLNPDLILQFSGWTPELESNLQGTDIAVARLGFKMVDYTSEVARLGYVLGTEDSASEIIDFHDGYMKIIGDGVDGLSEEEKPKVFLEWDPDYQTDTNGSLHQLCEMAGGVNIAADLPGKNPTIDAEWLMTEDPDVMVKFPFRKTADHGYTVDDPSELERLRESVMFRPGSADINAVKEGRVYVVGQEIVSGPRALVAVAYLAKWFHPDLFGNLDPQAIHQEYLTRFQGLDYDLSKQGVFVYLIPEGDGR